MSDSNRDPVLPTAAGKAIGIAVIVVTRNHRAALEDTVRAVLALDDPRVTLYVVDGASTDGSAEYLKSLKSSRLEWISEPDTGIYDAMNKGWRMVPTDSYVLYMGAGDKPLRLPTSERLTSAAERGIRIYIGDCKIGELEVRSRWTDELYRGNTAHHQALMIQKSLNPAPPFDATLKVYADWDFNVRLFKSGQHARYDDEFRSYALPGGVSASIDLWEVWRVCLRSGGFVNALRAVRMNWRAKRSLARNRAMSR